MLASQFISEITKSGNQIRISGETISDQVNIQSNLHADGISIEKCVFEKGFFLENVDLNCGIKFIDCHFIKNVSINNCTATKYDQVFNFDGYHLEFKNTKIDEGLFFNDKNQIERGVRIYEKSIIQRIQVKTLISNKGSFDINDSTIEKQFDISQAQINNNVSIRNNCIIDSKLRFENITCGSIVFTDSNFKKDIHIWAGKVGSLIFNDGIFEDDLSIMAVPISSLTVIGTDFKKSINFTIQDNTNRKTGSLNHVFIRSGKFGEQFIINGSNNLIDELTIVTSKQLEGDMYFNSCEILLTKISGDNYKSNIVFNHSVFNKLNFDFFNNYSTLSLISVKAFNPESEITIAHSNIGKTQFFNAFLNTFEKIRIYNSVLTEIIAANVKWFDDKKLNPQISVSSEEYTYKKEIYRQIKYALEKQGDRITSLHFKALEMRAFKNESFAKVRFYKKIFGIDRFILWIGQTNNFGQNWLKPVLFAIGFTLLFYFLIVVGISAELSYRFNFSKESIQFTWRELEHYSAIIPQLLNPTNTLSKILPENVVVNFTVNLWDYLLKIFLAFFIVQVISAFRKYMK